MFYSFKKAPLNTGRVSELVPISYKRENGALPVVEKVVRQPCNQVIKMKSTDTLCSLTPCAKKAQHHFYVVPVKKAWPECGPKETWTDPHGGPCPGMKGLHSLKLSAIHVSRTDWGTAPD